MNPANHTAVLHPLIGQALKQYRIDSMLGQGGMGVVYRAYDLKLQRPLAIKFLTSQLTADPERRRQFLLEARSAARISHPAIAQIYDVDEHAGAIFIALEFIEGKTLRELIQDKALDVLGAIEIAIQVAGGLAKAHQAGIVHRDIKPANIILTPDGHAKILDFGVAKLLDPTQATTTGQAVQPWLTTALQTQSGIVKGTPAYMSPEQVKGEKVDPRSDLFALGILLFEMVTWEMPFHRASQVETMHAIAFEDPPPIYSLRANLPASLQRIITRCLRKLPAERYSDAEMLLKDLRALRREMESGQARSISLRERISEVYDRILHLKPAQYAWLAGAGLAAALVIYLIQTNVGLGSFVFYLVLGLYLYRDVRHQPQRMRELFVRRMMKIPEVRIIVCLEGRVTLAVDRASSQLYQRVNAQLNLCNRRLFFGQPLTLVIRHDLTAEEIRQLLASPGIQYVRDDLVQR